MNVNPSTPQIPPASVVLGGGPSADKLESSSETGDRDGNGRQQLDVFESSDSEKKEQEETPKPPLPSTHSGQLDLEA